MRDSFVAGDTQQAARIVMEHLRESKRRLRDIKAMFKEMDANGDGDVSREEITAIATQRTEEVMARFDRMDADVNGVVTPSERRRYAFDRMDSDGDGQITKSEFREARKDRRRMMPERGGHLGQGKGQRKGMGKGSSESN